LKTAESKRKQKSKRPPGRRCGAHLEETKNENNLGEE
jgi:hypothetical protein